MGNRKEAAQRLMAQGFRFFPTNTVSRGFGRITRSAASRWLIRPYAAAFGIDLEEAEHRPSGYASLNEFFSRRLRPGVRSVDRHPDRIVSPVDGRISANGRVLEDKLLQVKGIHYDLFGLLRDQEMAARFENGSFMTIYLSPRDYHRIHAPLDITIHSMGYVPGALLPVNEPSVQWIPNLFTQNERLMVYGETAAGPVAVVMVGAHCVGSIRLAFAEFETNHYGAGPCRRTFDPPVFLQKGQELGRFETGSTVVLLFAPGKIRLDGNATGRPVKMGEGVGQIESPAGLGPAVSIAR